MRLLQIILIATLLFFCSGPVMSANVVGPKTIIEIQPQGHDLGDTFTAAAVQSMLDSSYTHLTNLFGSAIGQVTMEEIATWLEQSGGYGILAYGAHGGQNQDTGGQTFATQAEAITQKAWLETWQYFNAGDLDIGQNPAGTYWMLTMTTQYTNFQPSGCDIAWIHACWGSGDFNANCLVSGAGCVTNGALLSSFSCMMSWLASKSYKTVDLAASKCMTTMSTPPFAYVVSNGDWQIFPFSNAAAAVHSFAVIDGQAEWWVESEYQTASYRVYGAQTMNGNWTEVVLEAARAGFHSVSVSGYQIYRLIEVEDSGNEIHLDFAKNESVQTPIPRQEPTLSQKRAQYDSKMLEMQALMTTESQTPLGLGKKRLIYTEDNLVQAVQSSIADFWEYFFSYDVDVISLDSLGGAPENRHQAIKTDVASYYSTWGSNLSVFLAAPGSDSREFDMNISGSSYWINSWVQIHDDLVNFNGFPAQGNPERSIIPYFVIADTLPRTQGTGWSSPYIFTDDPIADVDDDGLLDIPAVSRVPFETETDVWNYGMKLFQNLGSWGAQRVAFFAGDLDHGNVGSGGIALALANGVENLLPTNTAVSYLRESQYPFDSVRNTEAANLWNSFRPELVFMFSSWSNRYWPANFFDLTNATNPWTMSMLTSGHNPVVIAASCGTADTWRTQDPNLGTTTVQRFLTSWGPGAIVWIGPSNGSWQDGNDLMARYIAEELYADPSIALDQALMLAKNRIYTEYTDEGVILTAQSYLCVGDGSSRVVQASIATGIATETLPRHTDLGNNYPNPFNPMTRIPFATTRFGHVSIKIYNVTGQLVDTLIDDDMPAGNHVIDWRAGSLASGVYFYHLNAEGMKFSQKMILLK